MRTAAADRFPSISRAQLTRVLLDGGVAALVFYVAMDITASSMWHEYRFTSQVVSELSAIDAPTRPLWLALGAVYDVLMFAFAFGAWFAAGNRRSLRVVAVLMFALATVSTTWALFPMHQRGAATTLTDTVHAVYAGIHVILTLCAIGFAASALGHRFRVYSLVSVAVMLLAGVATFVYAPKVAAHLPTPGIGLLERVNIYGYQLWIAMLALALRKLTPATG